MGETLTRTLCISSNIPLHQDSTRRRPLHSEQHIANFHGTDIASIPDLHHHPWRVHVGKVEPTALDL